MHLYADVSKNIGQYISNVAYLSNLKMGITSSI